MQDTMNGLYHLASQAKNVHWNVTGPSFYGIHKICDEIDATARDLGDRVAERMRFKEEMPMIQHDSTLTTVPQTSNATQLVDSLLEVLQEVYTIAEQDRRGADSPEKAILDDIQEDLGKFDYFLSSFNL